MERLSRCVTGMIAGLLLAHLAASAPAQVTWTRASVLEPRRSPLAYDSARGRAVLFDGLGLSDTWELDGNSWVRRFPMTSPSARGGHGLAYDSLRRRVVLFGGGSTTSTLSDTWEWDGNNWIQRSPVTSPSARSNHALAYDSTRGRTVLFGGYDSSGGYLSDTWEWDGVDWLRRSPAVSPPTLASVMVYDSARSRMVLFGGQDALGHVISDTWEWDGSNWIRRSPTTSPPARRGHGMAYDSARSRVVLFGGVDFDTYRDLPGTWEWDGNDWMRRSPANSAPLRSWNTLTYDTSRGRVLLFGGFVNDIRLPRIFFSDVWEWDGTDWVLRSPNACPTGRYGHALAYDPVRRGVLLYGGSSNPPSDMWIWDGGRWEELLPANRPPPFSGHYMVTDSVRRVVLLCGASAEGFSTWQWDGNDWLRRYPTNSPGQRDRHGLAFDSSRGRAVLFGGIGNSGYLADTWEWDGANWTPRSSPVSPSRRAGHALAYDSARRRVILFGGVFIGSVGGHPLPPTYFSDTWEWDGSNWVQRFPKTIPTEKDLFVTLQTASDEARGRVVLVGSGTWEWDGSDWLQRSPLVSPTPPGGSPLAYDSSRRRVVRFGGGSSGSYSSLWEYGPLNPASYASFGSGCGGSAGTPMLQAATDQLPWTGDRMTLGLSGLPPGNSALIWLGSSKTSWGSFRLPLDLGSVGMPGCSLQVSADWFFPVFNFTGRGSVGFDIPDDDSLMGASFYNQALVVDPRANAFGATVSNGGEGRIGAR